MWINREQKTEEREGRSKLIGRRIEKRGMWARRLIYGMNTRKDVDEYGIVWEGEGIGN